MGGSLRTRSLGELKVPLRYRSEDTEIFLTSCSLHQACEFGGGEGDRLSWQTKPPGHPSFRKLGAQATWEDKQEQLLG